MEKLSRSGGRLSLRARRRTVLAAVYALLATGAAFGAASGGAASAPTAARGPASNTARPPATAASKEAARAQYAKAKDLYDAQKYAEAQAENERALVLDPANSDALLMKRVLEGKLAGGGAGGATAAATGPAGKPTPLTPTQISLIRLYEMPPNDLNIKGKIDRAVLEEFWNEVYIKDPLHSNDTSKQAHDKYLNPTSFPMQVFVFKEANQQKYLEKISLQTDPPVLTAFKTNVQPYMMANCATSECHGGDKAGNFRLLQTTGTTATPEVFYTNFYIMSMYANKDGKMIDRDAPEKSLFLQYSLPWSSASAKHPKTELKKIPNMQDVRVRQFSEWVRALALPRPEYGITYEVPGAK